MAPTWAPGAGCRAQRPTVQPADRRWRPSPRFPEPPFALCKPDLSSGRPEPDGGQCLSRETSARDAACVPRLCARLSGSTQESQLCPRPPPGLEWEASLSAVAPETHALPLLGEEEKT